MKNLRLKLFFLCVMSIITLGASAETHPDYLCFTLNNGYDGYIVLTCTNTDPIPVEYSYDSYSWIDVPVNDQRGIELLSNHNKIYFRKKGDDVAEQFSSPYVTYQFGLRGSIAVSGNIMSLIDQKCETKTIPCEYCFYKLFEGCTNLTSAPELPAKTLVEGCYARMFAECTSLNFMKVGFTEWPNESDYEIYNLPTFAWVDHISDDGVFVCPDALDKTQTGVYDFNYIPLDFYPVFEVKANKDSKSENYYSTFYSGNNAYELPYYVTAYTGRVEGNVLKLVQMEDDIIPPGEAVILKSTEKQFYLEYYQPSPFFPDIPDKSEDNELSGTDEETTLGANNYALSLGQYGVGFYDWSGRTIGANKAYLTLPGSQLAPGRSFGMVFDDGTVTGIPTTILDQPQDDVIYNLQGQKVDESCKGLIIKNGQKVYNF